jgi:hypothetical protein
MYPERPRSGTMWTATPRDGSTHPDARLGAERSLVQIQSPRLTRARSGSGLSHPCKLVADFRQLLLGEGLRKAHGGHGVVDGLGWSEAKEPVGHEHNRDDYRQLTPGGPPPGLRPRPYCPIFSSGCSALTAKPNLGRERRPALCAIRHQRRIGPAIQTRYKPGPLLSSTTLASCARSDRLNSSRAAPRCPERRLLPDRNGSAHDRPRDCHKACARSDLAERRTPRSREPRAAKPLHPAR